ncbi:MAG: Ig-like domain-containing protein, partial [Lachnospiraceae bacterium]|nr:Ig-like domain-containing protein [Lachnospiraceae bacterium]
MTETETKKFLWRKLFALMLALCVCFSALGSSVMAAEDDEYYEDEDYDEEDYDDEQTEWDGTEGEDEYDGNVTWESDEPSVASVKNGVVTAKKSGEASITAIVTIHGEEYEAYCDITVAKVTLASKEISINAGQSATLKIKSRYPEDDRVDDWDINEGEKFIKLSQKKNGSVVISGKKKGTAKVVVYMESGAEATCIVKVKAAVPTKTLSFAKKNISMAKGSKAALKVTRTPGNATDTIKWTSSKKKVATVDAKGTVTAKGVGKTVITAKAANKKATCTITVTAPAKLTLKNTNATIKVRKSAN